MSYMYIYIYIHIYDISSLKVNSVPRSATYEDFKARTVQLRPGLKG